MSQSFLFCIFFPPLIFYIWLKGFNSFQVPLFFFFFFFFPLTILLWKWARFSDIPNAFLAIFNEKMVENLHLCCFELSWAEEFLRIPALVPISKYVLKMSNEKIKNEICKSKTAWPWQVWFNLLDLWLPSRKPYPSLD